ncbi:hypothetical protein J2X73_002509 [Novosphingobium sp. 1748]|nr:hypothetical protein [Novosphingobium sp. 1748]
MADLAWAGTAITFGILGLVTGFVIARRENRHG